MKYCLMLLLLTLSTTANAHFYKKTKSNICHSDASPYFDRITNYEKYYELDGCVAAGGIPSRWDRETTTTTSVPEYNRNEFGTGWSDIDRDCQNTRQEVLIDQSTEPVYFADNDECRVVRGRWISVFTNNIITNAGDIDVDHVVPLKWAWDHGAYLWSKQKRIQFANDHINLVAVEAALNRAKGAKGPDEWLPPKNSCWYVYRFLRIVKLYELQPSASELENIQEYVDEFCV